MRLIRRRADYDRKWLLAEAEKARARGRRQRAISLYRRILAAEPHEPNLHARIAPLLAAAGKRFDAWQSYQQAAQTHLKNQSRGEALALYRDAAKTLPMQIEAWQWVARLELKCERREAAINALLADPRLQDPAPRSEGSMAASGDPFDTADWEDPDPGNLRVDYVLPSSDWRVLRSGVYWPDGEAGVTAAKASSHRLVWVDLAY